MSPAVWYFARSAGIVAYLLLSASVVAGTLMAGRASFTWPRFAVEELHRFLAILTGIFVVLHGASLLLDRVVTISLAQMLVPFSSSYRPLAVGLGTTAAELLAAVGLTNLLRAERAGGRVCFQRRPFGERAIFENPIAIVAGDVHVFHRASAALLRGGSSIRRRFFFA